MTDDDVKVCVCGDGDLCAPASECAGQQSSLPVCACANAPRFGSPTGGKGIVGWSCEIHGPMQYRRPEADRESEGPNPFPVDAGGKETCPHGTPYSDHAGCNDDACLAEIRRRNESEFADVNGTGDTVQSREQTNSLHLSREPRLAYAQGFKDGGDELRARVAELEAELDRMKRLYQRMERSRWEAREHVAILSGEGPSAFADAKKKEADRG